MTEVALVLAVKEQALGIEQLAPVQAGSVTPQAVRAESGRNSEINPSDRTQ
jgi:hypothetical protein